MKLDSVLSRITGLIVRACDPDRVVLFGSHAKGADTVESDIDILVIGSFSGSPYLRGQELREMLNGMAIRVDLHAVTAAEILAEQKLSPHGFLASILSSGLVMYERAESLRSKKNCAGIANSA